MQVELQCPQCDCRFTLQPEVVPDEVPERETWFAMGDGETIEDSLHSALTACGPIHCPECGAAVPVTEESLSEMALEVLARW